MRTYSHTSNAESSSNATARVIFILKAPDKKDAKKTYKRSTVQTLNRSHHRQTIEASISKANLEDKWRFAPLSDISDMISAVSWVRNDAMRGSDLVEGWCSVLHLDSKRGAVRPAE